MVKDNTGFTPVQIVSDKGHQRVALFLSSQQRAQGNNWLKRICGGKIAHFGFAPILFCTIINQTVLFMNSVLTAPNLTKVTAAIGFWGWAAISFAVGSLIMFYRCSSQDPGYIKRAGDLGSHIDTERNKRDFFIFICMGTLTSSISAAVTVQRIWTAVPTWQTEEIWIHHVIVQYPILVAFLCIDILSTTTLTVAQASQTARNITTNELVNAIRYGYLRGPDGRFRNPYNHGCRKNCADFFIHAIQTTMKLLGLHCSRLPVKSSCLICRVILHEYFDQG